jgi:hypothetical protein
MERGFSILSIDAICASVQNGITPPMMREYRPMAAPFAERGVAEPPTLSFRRGIVRSDGNAQKSVTAPEDGRRPNVAKGAKVRVEAHEFRRLIRA